MREVPLWEKVWLGRWSKAYLNAGKIIGHLGCRAMEFFDKAKLLPDYEQYRYESVVRDLTVWAKREQGEYELHGSAKKILRVILGPAPSDPEYKRWWELRLISVEQMKRDGQAVEWAEAPPVPIEPDEPKAAEPTPKARKPKAQKAKTRKKPAKK